MDAGYKDENGYIYITARDDDIINVAGHRISTMALEDAVLRHPDVSDAAVFGVPEPTKGEVPLCLYIMKDSTNKASTKIGVEIIKIIREVIGPIASFRLVAPVAALPRTRSGKSTTFQIISQFRKIQHLAMALFSYRKNSTEINGRICSEQTSDFTRNHRRSKCFHRHSQSLARIGLRPNCTRPNDISQVANNYIPNEKSIYSIQFNQFD